MGNTSSEKNLTFTLDTIAPDPPGLDMLAVSDSGVDDTDNITMVRSPTFRVSYALTSERLATTVFTSMC